MGIRIAELKKTVSEATEAKRLDMLGELHALERRHQHLDEQLRQAESDGQGVRQDVAANLSLLADNIQGGLDSFVFSIESHYAAGQRAKSKL